MNKRLENASTVLLLILVVAIPSMLIGYYVKGSPASISDPVFEHPIIDASYVVFKDGTTYYAKNGETGEIDYSGINFTAVFENIDDCGGAIFIKDGTYEVQGSKGSLLYPKSGTSIVGEGNSTILQSKSGYDSHMIEVYGEHDIRIANLRLDGNRDTKDVDVSHSGIVISVQSPTTYSYNIICENLWIHDFHQNGIVVTFNPDVQTVGYECRNVIIKSIYTWNMGRQGVYVCGIRCTLSQVFAWNNGYYGIKMGSKPSDTHCTDCVVSDCILWSNDIDGLRIASGNFTVSNVIVHDNWRSGINAEYAPYNASEIIRNVEITNCIAYNNSQRSYTEAYYYGGFGAYAVNGITWTGCYAYNEIRGWQLRYTNNSIIEACTVGGCINTTQSKSIYLVDECYFNQIKNNRLYDPKSTSETAYGIRITADCDYTQIWGNMMTNMTESDFLYDSGCNGTHNSYGNNIGYNPVGYIASPWNDTNSLILDSGGVSTPTNDTTYTVTHSGKTIYISGGTMQSITVNGQQVLGAITDISITLMFEETIKFRWASGDAPTFKVMGH